MRIPLLASFSALLVGVAVVSPGVGSADAFAAGTGIDTVDDGAVGVCQAALAQSQAELRKRQHASTILGLAPDDARALLAAAEDRAARAEAEVKTVRQQLQQSKAEVLSVTRAALAGEASRDEQLDESKTARDQDKKDSESLVAQMKLRMDDLVAERDKAVGQLTEAQRDPAATGVNAALKAELAAAHGRADSLARHDADLERQLGALGVQLASAREKGDALAKTAADRATAATDAADRDTKALADARAELASTRTTLASLRGDLAGALKRADGLAEARRAAEEDTRAARARLVLAQTDATAAGLRTQAALTRLDIAKAEGSTEAGPQIADMGPAKTPIVEPNKPKAAKGDPGRAEATLLTPDPSGDDTSPTLTARSVAVSQTDAALGQADDLVRQGAIAEARAMLAWAARKGSGEAALKLGDLYDPAHLSTLHAVGVRGDRKRADAYYRQAAQLGIKDAEARSTR